MQPDQQQPPFPNQPQQQYQYQQPYPSQQPPQPYQPYGQPQYQQPQQQTVSYFDGTLGQWIGYNILCFLIALFTLGIATPWGLCLLYNWETKHTVVEGRRLRFDGTGGQLIGKYIVWMLLTLITLGIYGFWLGIRLKQWRTKHTFFDCGTPAP